MLPITPMIKGDFHYATSRGRICIMVRNLDDVQNQEDSLQMYIMKFGLVVQLLYTLSFVRRIRKYVLRQCPGKKLSSIGRYPRNVVDLRWEFSCSVLGSCFPGLDYVVRKISMTQTPKFTFFVNFVLLDSVHYLFFIIFFWSVSRQLIPSKTPTQQKCYFYISPRPQYLEPRRSEEMVASLRELKRVINVSEHNFFPNIPLLVRDFVSEGDRQYRVTNYVSTRRADTSCQRRNGIRLETSNIDKLFKIDRTFKIDKTSQIDKTSKIDLTCQNMQDQTVFPVQLKKNPEALDDLFKPCSSTKTFKPNSRFNYMHW